MITPQQYCCNPVPAPYNESLYKLPGCNPEKGRHILHTFFPRSYSLFERQQLSPPSHTHTLPIEERGLWWGRRLCLLHIRRIPASVTGDYCLFTCVCKNHKLMGKTPPDQACISLNRFKDKPATPENGHIRIIHLLI